MEAFLGFSPVSDEQPTTLPNEYWSANPIARNETILFIWFWFPPDPWVSKKLSASSLQWTRPFERDGCATMCLPLQRQLHSSNLSANPSAPIPRREAIDTSCRSRLTSAQPLRTIFSEPGARGDAFQRTLPAPGW